MIAVALLGLVVVALMVAETVGRRTAASQIEDRLRAAGVTGSITADVGGSAWRPSVLAALTTGSLDRVQVDVADGRLGELPVQHLTYTLTDVSGEFRPMRGDVTVDAVGSLEVRLRLDPVVVAAAQAAGRPIVDAYWVPCVAEPVATARGAEPVDGSSAVDLGCTAAAVPGFLRSRPSDVGGPAAPGAEVLPDAPPSVPLNAPSSAPSAGG